MTALYEDFICRAEGKNGQHDWRKALIYQEIVNQRTSGKRGIRRWMTRESMAQHFTAQQVEDIICRKETDPNLREVEIRDHPESPSACSAVMIHVHSCSSTVCK